MKELTDGTLQGKTKSCHSSNQVSIFIQWFYHPILTIKPTNKPAALTLDSHSPYIQSMEV
jgi:hypothetical protein